MKNYNKLEQFADSIMTLCEALYDCEEIDVNTLESKIVKGLYFSGEVIDIDGICGGYNLQLAYSTASIIAKVFKE